MRCAAAGLSVALGATPGHAADAGTKRAIPIYDYEVMHAWPHDSRAYTQGLASADGLLYESTGRYGSSSLRIVEPATGRVLKQIDLAARYFGEGIALLHNKVFQLTWRAERGFIYEPRTLERVGEFRYAGEGWGLTTDGKSLIMSDGTHYLRFLDAQTFAPQRALRVMANDEAVTNLNELEYVRGEVFANIWQRDTIARVDPQTGAVRGWIDLSGLRPADTPSDIDAVLNGIAYDAVGDRLFVTGKLWPKLYEIRLKLRQPANRP